MRLNELFDGKYRVIKLLGAGGCGRVYLAENINLGTHVAIKEIAVDDQSRGMVEQEVEVLKGLRHPALPRILDVVREEGALCIVEDFIEGQTVERHLEENGPAPEDTAIRWGVEICDIMAFLHAQEPDPVIYRDLKPANIIISESGSIRLVDFGSARHYKSWRDSDTVYIGTRGYAAPEQYGYGQTSVRTDVYSFGMTMAHIVTGVRPVQGAIGQAACWKPWIDPKTCLDDSGIEPDCADGETEAQGENCPCVSPELEAIIDQCSQTDESARYAGFAEIKADLIAARESLAMRTASVIMIDPAGSDSCARALAAVAACPPATPPEFRVGQDNGRGFGDGRKRPSELAMSYGARGRLAGGQSFGGAGGQSFGGAGPAGGKDAAVACNAAGAVSLRAESGVGNGSAKGFGGDPSIHAVCAGRASEPCGAYSSGEPAPSAAQYGSQACAAPGAGDAPRTLFPGRCVTISVVGDAEFGCELAYHAAQKHGLRALIADFDLERCSAVWIMGLGDPLVCRPQLGTQSSMRRATDAIARAREGSIGILGPGASNFVERGDHWPKGLAMLSADRPCEALELQDRLAGGDGELISQLFIEATAGFDLCVALAGPSMYCPLASHCFRLSHGVAYTGKPDAAGVAAYSSFVRLAEDKGVAPVSRCWFVAWDYDDWRPSTDESLNSLEARSVLGGVRRSKKRDMARSALGARRHGVKAAAPVPSGMERAVQKDYDAIIGALGIKRME